VSSYQYGTNANRLEKSESSQQVGPVMIHKRMVQELLVFIQYSASWIICAFTLLNNVTGPSRSMSRGISSSRGHTGLHILGGTIARVKTRPNKIYQNV
jgi:hypothetical protein